jgi:hypothetical protein
VTDKWADNSIQFPRLIAELEAAGAFTPEVLTELRELMDLDAHDVMELVDRAQAQWDHIKAGL